MHVLIAPDKFKGSLSSVEAADAIKRGILRVWTNAQIHVVPIADGGEGTAEALCSALGGRWIQVEANDPLGRPVKARYAWIDSDIAVIEMSEASGLWRIPVEKRDPLRSTTFGTGQLITDALRRGATTIYIGIGGSATNDGGIGMASALGYRFLTETGNAVNPTPAALPSVRQIQSPEKNACFHRREANIIALCDVQNPLLGERGASRTYGPQKGADPAMIETLEKNLEHLADLVSHDLRCDFRETAGSGAAGGLGFGLLSFCGASIRSGFDTVAEILRLEDAIAESDLVITGEGCLDAQTLEGKGPAGVAALARKQGKPVIALAGSVTGGSSLTNIFDATCSITDRPMPLEDALRDAAALLEQGAEHAARLLCVGKLLSRANHLSS